MSSLDLFVEATQPGMEMVWSWVQIVPFPRCLSTGSVTLPVCAAESWTLAVKGSRVHVAQTFPRERILSLPLKGNLQPLAKNKVREPLWEGKHFCFGIIVNCYYFHFLLPFLLSSR